MTRQDRQFRITKFKGKAIAVAVGAMFSALAAQNAMADNIPDGGTVANTNATTVVFTGAASSLTGIATIADGNSVLAVTVTNSPSGTLTFLGAATGTTVGTGGGMGPSLVGLVNFNGGTGKTVSLTGALFATNVSVAGVGTYSAGGDVNAAVNFAADGTLSVAANSKIVGALDSSNASTGTATFAATTATTTLVSGIVGGTQRLKALNVAPVTGITATIGSGATTVAATTITHSGAGTVAFVGTGDVTGAVKISGGGTVAVTGGIVGSVDNTGTAGTGTLTFVTAGKNVNGAIGATNALATVNINNGAPVTFAGAIKATNVNLTGTNTATLQGDVTGTVNFTADGTAATAANTKIVGSVATATTNTGTLTVTAATGASSTIVSGSIGATGKLLKAVTLDATAVTATVGGDVFATTTNVGATASGTTAFSGNVTGTSVVFGGDGTVTVAAGKNITAAVTTATTNNGTLSFLGGTTTGGDIGVAATPLILKAVNFATGTVSIGNNISATNINFNGTTSAVFTAAKTLTGAVAAAAGATLDTGTVNTSMSSTFSTTTGTTLKAVLAVAPAGGVFTATGNGLFTVAGNATVVAGTKVFVNVGSTLAVADGQKFKIVDGTGGTNVADLTAGNVTTNSAVLSFTGKAGNNTGTLAATGEDLYVVATRAAGGFTGVSSISSTAPGASGLTTLNTIAVGVPTVGSDMATVVNTFNGYSAAQLLTEAPKLAPTTGSASTGAGMGTVSQSLNVVSTRLASIRGDSSQLASGVAASGVAAGSAPGREVWVKGFGNNNSQGAFDGYSGYSGRSYGLAFGADTNVGSNTRLGLGLSYAKANVGWTNDGNAGAGSAVSVNSYQLTGYGSRDFGKAYVDGMVSYARHNSTGKRLAALAKEATYSTNADQWTGRIGAGYRIAMAGKTVFTPLASIEWTSFNQNAYSESGAGALSLNVNSVTVNRTKGGVGFRISGEGKMATGTVFKPEMHVGVYNDFNNGGVDTAASFSGGTGSFTTPGQKVQRTSYNVGAGVTFLQGRSGSVGVVYDYEARSSFKGHNFQVQGRWSF